MRKRVMSSSAHRRSSRAARSSAAWAGLPDSSASTRGRLAGRPGRTSRPTPGCSMRFGGFSQPREPPARDATMRAAFRSTIAKGRCDTCAGEGFVMVELLFLPSVYAPCPACHGARYNAKTLEIKYRDKSVADVLNMTVDVAVDFFVDEPAVRRVLEVLREVGLGYLRLGQPATELSG